MGIGSSIGDAVGSNKQLKAAKNELKNQRGDRERALGLAADQDVEPVYASQQAPTFQRSRSPVADAFLESLITGNNASAVQGTRANAPAMRARAQATTDKRYGPADALLADQRAMEQATPWQPKPITKPVVSGEMRMRAQQTPGDELAMRKYGLSPEQLLALESLGIKAANSGALEDRGAARNTANYLTDAYASGNSRAFDDFIAEGQTGRNGVDLAMAIRNGQAYANGRGSQGAKPAVRGIGMGIKR